MKRVLFHSLAQIELDNAVAYYEEISAGLGLTMLDEVIAATNTIGSFPLIGSIDEHTEYRHLVLDRFPYILFYIEHEDNLWIVAVAHGKRKPGYWLGRQV